MKKMLLITIIFIILSFIILGNKKEKEILIKEGKEVSIEKRGIFVSYLELEDHIKNKSVDESKSNIINMINNIHNLKFNMIILHVRPFSDSIYDSNIYPYSNTISNEEGIYPGYDILKFIIEKCKEKKIEVHAWINPYRIRNDTDTSTISVNNPAYELLNTNDVKIIEDKGIFYNPASSKVNDLILNGIKEIITNYDVDGIHFDDYFYPDDSIDLQNYNEYIENGGNLSVEDYRYNVILTLLKNVYDLIKSINKNVEFGISPEGNIENDYKKHYLDINTLLSKPGYIDYIMPQIYFGFENQTKPFINTVEEWNKLIKVDSIKFMPALAFYKAGNIDSYAGRGREEWINNSDIIKRQIIHLKKLQNYNGFSLFRYDSIFNNKYDNTEKELENLKDIIN